MRFQSLRFVWFRLCIVVLSLIPVLLVLRLSESKALMREYMSSRLFIVVFPFSFFFSRWILSLCVSFGLRIVVLSLKRLLLVLSPIVFWFPFHFLERSR